MLPGGIGGSPNKRVEHDFGEVKLGLLEHKEIIVAILAIFGGVAPYLLQRRKEQRQKLSDSKREAYAKFLDDFTETVIAVLHDQEVERLEADKRRITARNQLLLFASDEVISVYDQWYRLNQAEGHDVDNEVKLFGRLLIEIRRDIHGNSKLNADQIEGLNPFATG